MSCACATRDNSLHGIVNIIKFKRMQGLNDLSFDEQRFFLIMLILHVWFPSDGEGGRGEGGREVGGREGGGGKREGGGGEGRREGGGEGGRGRGEGGREGGR